ncbi:MAG TPA: GNAT family N-acetyltransferase, partial [Thermoplasmata archaeon]|nr:GNAT family N-acetyltransferase [Thermoplasmata archaeon]
LGRRPTAPSSAVGRPLRPTSGRPASRLLELGPGDEAKVLGAAALFDHALSRRAVRAFLSDRRNLFLLAHDVGGRPIGFARGTVLGQLHTARPQFFLYEIAVDGPSRRRGVGSALIRRLLRLGSARGFDELFVFTDDPANRAAHRLYRSTGGRTETEGERMYVYPLARPVPRRGSRPRAG